MWKCLYIAWALSEGRCGILTMIDTPILAILYEKKIFKNLETSLYSTGFVSRTVWNTTVLVSDCRFGISPVNYPDPGPEIHQFRPFL